MSLCNPLFLSDWRALILAAGFGTRLLPLTERLPKPLVPVAGVPMLALTLNRFRRLKPRIMVVNGHHLAVQVESFLEEHSTGFQKLKYLYEPLILDTGGAVRNAARYLRGPFFVTSNADAVNDIALLPAVARHLRQGSLVTMLLHDREPYNQVEVDASGRIVGFALPPKASANRLLAYTGIQICSPVLLDLMAREAPGRPFPLIPFYRRLLAAGRTDLAAYVVDTRDRYYWRDLGTPEDLAAVEADLKNRCGLAARLGVV
ncbi:MAG: NTP transferase domain-containing protein [Deltaproteobacteria bacterium]|nr:NTP transferase domain-containing protein [Deltaproteobacteria bacterium]